jgi:RNA polymerase sigma factor (sigma-70 family)
MVKTRTSESQELSRTLQSETEELIRIYQLSTCSAERERAAEKVISKNDKLVTFILLRDFPSYRGSDHFEDLIQEGRMGLFESLADYDPAKGAFSTHAEYRIKHNMYEYASKVNNSSIYYLSQIKKYKKAISALAAEGNTAPTITDIATVMGCGVEAVQKLIGVMNRANHISLDGDEETKALISDPLKTSPIDVVIENDEKEALADALKQLDKEQQYVIMEMFFGDGDKAKTLVDIGKQMGGRKPEDVKRIKQSAIRKLNRILTNRGYGTGYNDIYDPLADKLTVTFYPQQEVVQREIENLEFLD